MLHNVSQPSLTIISPCYNEQGVLINSIPIILYELNQLKQQHKIHSNSQILLIDDGSKDNTLEVIQKNNFNHIDGFCNLGLFGAVQTGFKLAMKENYDVVIQFDGDGQHSAKYIDAMVKEIENGRIL